MAKRRTNNKQKKIRFRTFNAYIYIPTRLKMAEDYGPIQDKSTKPKVWIKNYIFNYISDEIKEIRDDRNFKALRHRVLNTKNCTKIKLNKEDIRMCIWIGIQRCKIVLKFHDCDLNMEDENNYLDEYFTLKN